ncbi:MAG: transposase [Ruminococcaceae bacterium]|nr:transposase [Oscillospiraceae bacterium]
MPLPERKQTRLKEYDYSTPGAYFITLCTNGRKRILSEIIVGDDAHIVPRVVLTEYGKTVEKYIKSIPGIDKYVIMPDHIHMIIIIDGSMWASTPTGIEKRIKSFKTLVTKNIGFSIFQRSYFDHVIRNRQDYEETWKYIESNPYRWVEKYIL